MSDLKYIPISCLDETLLQPLMEDEERMWRADLDWDYTPIRQVLVAFIRQKLLPGYVAISDSKALGYTYFLINQSKGFIGALYAMNVAHSQEAVDELLALSISYLKGTQNTKRVEAQIMPFHHLNIASAFTRSGFSHCRRYYLDLDLVSLPRNSLPTSSARLAGAAEGSPIYTTGLWDGTLGNHRNKPESPFAFRIIPWDAAYLSRIAEMTLHSYQNQVDAEICDDYCTRTGCESYVRSLVENPGCGIFIPEASFIGLDGQSKPCGFVFCCRISNGAAIIPQIAVHPLHQGRRLGNTLMNRAFVQLKALGFRTVSLTVTKENLRAFEWYQRLGFKMHKEFGAYVWQRKPNCE